MTLRADAIAAWNTSQNARVTAAKAKISTVLAPYSATPMTLLAVVTEGDITLGVFTDGDMAIGVRSIGPVDDWKVYLVKNDNGWTLLAPLTSLAQLGQVIPTLDPIVGP